MISIDQLQVSFGVKPLFTDVSFIINPSDRIALVGKNGAGKSTMLKILAGLQQPTSGCVRIPHEVTVGYLPQVMVLADGRTVRQETETAFATITQLQTRVAALQTQLAEREDYESQAYMALVEDFSKESERLQILGGNNYHAQMERTLLGLGFMRTDFDRPTSEFSGGWRMRIELAKILLQNPDVLLLDEPTNHLDIESIQWLENFLARSAKAVVLVSHDRAFINNVTNRTIEITCGQVVDYRVTYNEYLLLRAERREQQLRAYENQQKEMADLRDFIERFRYKPTKAVQVQSRIKQLEKIVPIEVDEVDRSSLRLKFAPAIRSGDYPIICEHVRKAYGTHTIFEDVDLTLKRGEKVAFVGKNGAGKSTLVKCIMNQISYEGTLRLGHQVSIGYYAQNQAQLLDDERTVFDTIDYVAKGDIRLKIRDILGAFMFGGDASDKKVKVLSGGERSRLAMIKLLLEPVNVLILDEPTNHLDMRTKDVLKEAIRDFDGTVIVVSHDREFLDGLVTKVYEFGQGRVREHLGGIYAFLQAKQIDTLDDLHAPALSTDSVRTEAVPVSPTTLGKQSYAEQKERQRQRRKVEKEIAAHEAEITTLEAAIALLEGQLSTADNANDTEGYKRHANLTAQLQRAMEQWEEAAAQLEQLAP